MTLAQFEALEERRHIALRYDRFNAALITSATYNVNRAENTEPIEPWDFLAGFDADPEQEADEQRKKQIRQSIVSLFTRLPDGADVQAMKTKVIERLKAQGHADADELFKEVFPQL